MSHTDSFDGMYSGNPEPIITSPIPPLVKPPPIERIEQDQGDLMIAYYVGPGRNIPISEIPEIYRIVVAEARSIQGKTEA